MTATEPAYKHGKNMARALLFRLRNRKHKKRREKDEDDDEASSSGPSWSADEDSSSSSSESRRKRRLVITRKQNRKFEARMTLTQELSNALTQIVPSIWYAYVAHTRELSFPAWCLVGAVWFHLPVSLVYHFRCALYSEVDPVGDRWRRLDNTAIHMAATCIAFATSLGQRNYSVGCLLFNSAAATLHWRHEINQVRNQWMTLFAVVLYVIPIALRYDFDNLLGALTTFFPAGLCFRTYYFGGFSHSLFHVGMALFAVFILNSVLEAEDDQGPFAGKWAADYSHLL